MVGKLAFDVKKLGKKLFVQKLDKEVKKFVHKILQSFL